MPSFMDRYASARMPATMKSPTPISTRRPMTGLRALSRASAYRAAAGWQLRRLGSSTSPWMNWRTTGSLEPWISAGVPTVSDPPFVEHRHPVGDLEDLRDLVTDHDRREAELPVKPDDQVVDRVDEDGVEPGRRLVEEHDLRLGHQRPRDGDPLAHAAGDLGRVLVRPCPRARPGPGLPGPAAGARPRGAGGFSRIGNRHVLEHGQRVEEGAALEHDAEALAHRGRGPARGGW